MKKILIVEDSTEINNMICDYLSKKLFECTQAFSGTEALLGCHAHYGRYLPNNAFLGRGDAALLEPACLESSKRRFDLHGVLHLGTAAPRLAHQRVFR